MPGCTIPPLPRLPALLGTDPKHTHRTDPAEWICGHRQLATFNVAVWAVRLAGQDSNHAVLHLLVSLPLIVHLVPDRSRAAVNAGREAQDVMHLAGTEQRTFMIMAAILVTFGLAVTMVSVHLLTLLQAQGLSLSVDVASGLLFGPAQDVARMVEMAGRHHPVLAFACGSVTAGAARSGGVAMKPRRNRNKRTRRSSQSLVVKRSPI